MLVPTDIAHHPGHVSSLMQIHIPLSLGPPAVVMVRVCAHCPRAEVVAPLPLPLPPMVAALVRKRLAQHGYQATALGDADLDGLPLGGA